jgi:hypothetical protein
MKYICFGYLDVENWQKKSESEQTAMVDQCLAYDETLKKNGNWVLGEGLKGPDTATTLRYRGGKVVVTDGPYAETKELLGGLLIIEARDLNHAIQLISKHPGVKMGSWEIRPVEDLAGMIEASEARRASPPRRRPRQWESCAWHRSPFRSMGSARDPGRICRILSAFAGRS